jgi:hypothetical protein
LFWFSSTPSLPTFATFVIAVSTGLPSMSQPRFRNHRKNDRSSGS